MSDRRSKGAETSRIILALLLVTVGVAAALLVRQPGVVVGLAAGSTLGMFLLSKRHRAHAAIAGRLMLVGLAYWTLVTLLIPGPVTGAVVLGRPEISWGPGVTWGGPLTTGGLWAGITGAARLLLAIALTTIAVRMVPGRDWWRFARRVLGGRAALVAPWCLLGDTLEEQWLAGWRGRRLWSTALAEANDRARQGVLPSSPPARHARPDHLLTGQPSRIARRLRIRDLDLWVPDRGRVLRELSADLSNASITAVVGRSGQGASLLLRALAQQLPAGARWRGHAILGAGGGESPTARLNLLQDLPDDLPGVVELVTEPQALVDAPPTPVLLVDNITTGLDEDRRREIIDELVRRADIGQIVLWATHDLDAAWEVADSVVELRDGTGQMTPITQWAPSTLPEPTLATLTRLLDLPPLRLAEEIAATRQATRLPPPPRSASRPTTPGSIRAVRLDLVPAGLATLADDAATPADGPLLAPGQSVGIVGPGAREAARVIVAGLDGVHLPDRLPSTWSMLRVARQWERRHDLPRDAVLQQVASFVDIRPRAAVGKHSAGEIAALRQAMMRGVPIPVWADEPQRDLDPVARHRLAGSLSGSDGAWRFITSSDVEFLTRACTTILVLGAADDTVAAHGFRGTLLGAGSPSAVLHLLPTRPLVARAVGSEQHLRLSDVVEAVLAA